MFYSTEIDPKLKIKELSEIIKTPVIIRVVAFDEESVIRFEEDMFRALESEQPVVPILIDSYGGDIYSVFAMADIIRTIKKPIATVVQAKALSCGAILFSCGTDGYRYVGPNATIMIHDVSLESGTSSKVEDMKTDSNELQRLTKLMYKMLAKNCKKTENYFSSMVHDHGHTDWYLTPQEAIKHNLANHIGTPKLKLKITAEISFT